jgi:enamine deaminase RidA (YjgF/YER057c/UK114 family)
MPAIRHTLCRFDPLSLALCGHPVCMNIAVWALLVHNVMNVEVNAQAEQAFSNLKRALEAAGSSLKDIVRVSIYLTDMKSCFEKVVALRRKYFTEPYPADTLLEVKGLYSPEAMIEIEAIGLVTK